MPDCRRRQRAHEQMREGAGKTWEWFSDAGAAYLAGEGEETAAASTNFGELSRQPGGVLGASVWCKWKRDTRGLSRAREGKRLSKPRTNFGKGIGENFGRDLRKEVEDDDVSMTSTISFSFSDFLIY